MRIDAEKGKNWVQTERTFVDIADNYAVGW